MTEIMRREWEGYQLLEPASPAIRERTIEETIETVRRMIGEQKRRIALLFPTETYTQSKLLALVIVCARLVRDAGGKLAVVGPHEDLLGLITDLGLDMGITFVPSLEELAVA